MHELTKEAITRAIADCLEPLMLTALRMTPGGEGLQEDERDRIKHHIRGHMVRRGYDLRQGWRLEVELRHGGRLDVLTRDAARELHDGSDPGAWVVVPDYT